MLYYEQLNSQATLVILAILFKNFVRALITILFKNFLYALITSEKKYSTLCEVNASNDERNNRHKRCSSVSTDNE